MVRAEASAEGPARGRARPLATAFRLARLVVALFVFVGALQLLKTGAASLSLLEPGAFLVENAGSTLGLGWLGALLVLSGSPVAATALALVAAREDAAEGAQRFSEFQGFAMLTGSRLGAAFVVLVTAVVYALREGRGGRRDPLGTAVMTLAATALVYVPAAVIGFALLSWAPFQSMELGFPHQFADVIDLVYGPVVDAADTLPAAVVFLAGGAALLVAFKLIDTVLPQLDERSVGGARREWLTRKWPMFGIGSLVAAVTMSVSVALTVLVPLVSKKYVTRDQILPYIMGANITTLGDTLFAAFALDSPAAVRIVIAELIGTTVVSVVLLTFFYPQIRTGVRWFARQFLKSHFRLMAFTAGLFLVPIVLIVASSLLG